MTAQKANPLEFRIGFIALPLAFLVITAALASVLYGNMPDEVYYRFAADGDPNSGLVSKGVVTLVILAAQAALLGLSFLLTYRVGKSRFFNENLHNFWFDPTKLLKLMGNMPAIIQVILTYAFLDIIIYYTEGSHFLAVWIFALATLVAGGIIMFIYALPIFRQALRGFNEMDKDKKE